MQKQVENYILYESVGAGQYGKVFRAKNQKTNETCAIKCVPLEKFTQVPKLQEFTENEIKTLSRINNPNVVKFIEMLKTTNNMYLVYEYCDGGTLEDILQRRKFLPEPESLKVFSQLINGFKSIYKENILHRDIKPSNILLSNEVVKIADFGFCKKMSSHQELTFTMVGSPIYMAPEVLKGFPYNIKADIWSLGVVLYELLFGVCPYEDKTLAGLISRIDQQGLIIPREINNISKETEGLLRKMLTLDSKQRIEWDELISWDFKVSQTQEVKPQSTSGTSLKLDLHTVNNFNDVFQKNIYQQELIIKALMKERNKIVFVSNLLHSTLEINAIPRSSLISFLLLKKICWMMDTLKKEISIENTHSKFKNFEKWDEFRNSEEYLNFSRYLNDEYDDANSFLTSFKQEIQGMVDAGKDSGMKTEIISSSIDFRFLHSTLVSYSEEIKNLALEKVKAKDDVNGFGLLLHANEVLDCDNLEEFFDKILIDGTLRLSDQTYFNLIKKFSKEKIQDLVSGKISNARSRVILI